jgi:glycosyltransferase involved in cell wall biosynthesis
VLQVVLSLNPGGTERLVVDLVERLSPEMPMSVCCLDESGAWAQPLQERGVTVTALGRRPGFQPLLGRAVAAAVRRHRATVVHAHHYSPYVYSCAARVWQSQLPIVFTEHGRLSDAGPSSKRRLANQVLARCAREVFAVSQDLRAHLVAEGFRADEVGVIYNGIEPGPLPDAKTRVETRAALGAADDAFVVGTIARLDPVKDLGTLVAAVAELGPDRRVVAVVVGDGPERAVLERAAAEAGVSDAVKFLGQRDDARRWLAACDVYVNSSISEGVSLTILEAMAAGLTPVVTRVGGTPEVVDDSCGRLVPSRDPRALAAALRTLAASPALRADLGLAARRRVEERFSLDRMVAAYADVYRRVGTN